MLEVNMKAPDFTLYNKEGFEVSLSDFRGKKVVLYFYQRTTHLAAVAKLALLPRPMMNLRRTMLWLSVSVKTALLHM